MYSYSKKRTQWKFHFRSYCKSVLLFSSSMYTNTCALFFLADITQQQISNKRANRIKNITKYMLPPNNSIRFSFKTIREFFWNVLRLGSLLFQMYFHKYQGERPSTGHFFLK